MSIWWTNSVKLFIIPKNKDWQTLTANKYMYPVRLHIEVFCLQWSTNFRFDRQLSPHTHAGGERPDPVTKTLHQAPRMHCLYNLVRIMLKQIDPATKSQCLTDLVDRSRGVRDVWLACRLNSGLISKPRVSTNIAPSNQLSFSSFNLHGN